ncbi:hypothetical protein JQN72_17635 [Phycicoccus sp. CSK15P-2]|uniref:hypothetical protein n=1 Tax=Phycicoccus sp. CSK15P-2 TaxID=2807627 RepID=UPI00194F3430|nr:hypothetical protein [Phycicoccus sp. CSK15P-2]MBM6406062.1 hypothetical protein [Phycicoccus sp. CSK15P-2]
MADIVVKSDLDNLLGDLRFLISEFQGALDLQNDDKGIWGQLNANLSMGDFAFNWTANRDAMVKDMKALEKQVEQVIEAWTDADQQLVESLSEN